MNPVHAPIVANVLRGYDWEGKPRPSFVDAIHAFNKYDWKEKTKTVIVEFLMSSSDHWYKNAFDYVKAGRKLDETLDHSLIQLEFERMNIDTVEVFDKAVGELVRPPIGDLPTYICYEDGIERTDGNGSPQRLVIDHKPTDAYDLARKIEEWMVTLGF